MMNGKIGLNRDDFVTLSDNNLRGHSQKLVVPMAHKNCRKYSFPVRVVPLWNKLPQGVVDSVSVAQFKQGISSVDFSPFLRYSD